MEKHNGMITFGGNPLTLNGKLTKLGQKAEDFSVLGVDLKPVKLSDFKGKKKLISVVPSIDTGVCDQQTRRFNVEAAKLENTEILTISVDLPFALGRYCATAGIDKIKTLSDHKDLNFGYKYGFVLEELRILARGIIIIDENDIVKYVEYVSEVGEHPSYDKALEEIKKL